MPTGDPWVVLPLVLNRVVEAILVCALPPQQRGEAGFVAARPEQLTPLVGRLWVS